MKKVINFIRTMISFSFAFTTILFFIITAIFMWDKKFIKYWQEIILDIYMTEI